MNRSITRIGKYGRNTKIRNIGIVCLTETGKIWDFEWSLSTKLDFGLEFALQIAVALETRLLSELDEKDGKIFIGADATLDLRALGEK